MTIRAWTHAPLMAGLDAAYGEGRYDDAVRLLRQIHKLNSGQETAD